MAKKIVVVSTLTAPVRYQLHKSDGRGAAPRTVREVLVKGGAGLADRFLQTVGAVETVIDAEQAEFLSQHRLFKKHQAAGFVKIVEADVDAESVAADMASRDGSAPMVDADFEAKAAGPKPKK